MPNALGKDLELMFEEFVLGHDAQCTLSLECDSVPTDGQTMQRAGDVFYQRQDYQASVVTGLDLSAAARSDVIQRFVPTSFRAPDNVIWELDAKELRDPEIKSNFGKAAALKLAVEVDKNIYETVARQAGIVVKKVGALSWEDGALAEAMLISRGASSPNRKLFLNPFDHLAVAKDLGNKAYMGDRSKDAYERSKVPDIATFATFRTDNQFNMAAAGTVSGITVSGAQSHTVTAMTGDVPTDNRRMTLTVAGANLTNVKNGDAFQIANVNAVHMHDKSDTGQPMTFRVISGAGTANVVITPALIATGPYQNVTAVAANGAAITFLNTATKPVNPFWVQGAVSIARGKLAFPSGEGVEVMTATTKQGVPLIMSYGFNHITGKVTCRFTTLYATTVLCPDQCGIIIANQI
jgi:hypothetical protein